MIRIATNSEGSGDYVIVDHTDDLGQNLPRRLFEGHKIAPRDLQSLMIHVQCYPSEVIVVEELTDKEMESI